MKNYLGRLGLPRKASPGEIAEAITEAMDTTSDIQSIRDAEIILSAKVMRTYYERAHLQYEAISTSLDCLHNEGALDTHRWADRVVEFDVELEQTLV